MKEIDYSSLSVDGIDFRDAPDYCDAFFASGEYTDGTPLPDSVLEDLSEDSDLLYNKIIDHIY